MAHKKFLLSLVVVLANSLGEIQLNFFGEIQLSFGGQLKPGKTAEFPELHTPQAGAKTLIAHDVNLTDNHARGEYVNELQSTSSAQPVGDTRSPPQVGAKMLIVHDVNVPYDPARGVYVKEAQSALSGQPVDDGRSPPPQGHVDDFRPTAPGRSPGVGHSIQT